MSGHAPLGPSLHYDLGEGAASAARSPISNNDEKAAMIYFVTGAPGFIGKRLDAPRDLTYKFHRSQK